MKCGDQRLFRFAVIGDSHLEPTPNAATSDVPQSNLRLRRCIDSLNAMHVDFVIHLGDVVHTLPGNDDQVPALAAAQDLLQELQVPIHYTPGNHDIGDKPQRHAPAASVQREWVNRFEQSFGAQWSCFDHKGCRYVLFNSLILNTGWQEEAEQYAWLESTVDQASGRVFVATHYPPFLTSADEPSYYDNIDEPARSRLLHILSSPKVEAVFTGHVHTWIHNRIGDADLYGVPSTAFVRRDFSEMFKVAPLRAFGREDPEKLGYVVVDVYEDAHVLRLQHVLGDERCTPAADDQPPDARARQWCGLGVDLRHPWAETIEMPFNPPVDAFVRKRVRNDYPALALCELGLRDLRVPIRDVLDETVWERARILRSYGFRFTAFFAEQPDPRTIARLQDLSGELDTLEVIAPLDEIAEAARPAAAAIAGTDMRLQLTPLLSPSSSERQRAGNHLIQCGFPPDAAAIRDSVETLRSSGLKLVATVAAPLETLDETYLAALRDIARTNGIGVSVLATWATADKDGTQASAEALARHMERIVSLLTKDDDDLRIFLDTFMEFDRSYHPRAGLIDRRCNLTIAGRALQKAYAQRASTGRT